MEGEHTAILGALLMYNPFGLIIQIRKADSAVAKPKKITDFKDGKWSHSAYISNAITTRTGTEHYY